MSQRIIDVIEGASNTSILTKIYLKKNSTMNKMKINIRSFMLMLFAAGALFLVGCDDDDPVLPVATGDFKIYSLAERNASGVSGTVRFDNLDNGNVLATITLSGTSSGNSHPAHIHENSAAEGGDIAITFNPVDGGSGISVTTITDLTYAQILAYDGYVNVHLSAQDLTVVAQADIGENELTGMEKQYTLAEKNASGVSGTITFAERMNGESLATIALTGTSGGNSHPAHIHENSAAEGGDIAVTFNQVDGETGMSMTNVSSITYSNLLTYDGYVNVHLSAQDLTVVAQADIGGNELTGTEKQYTLAEKNASGVSGTITFAERMNGESLATIALTGTPASGMHPAHIHENSAAEGGDIAVTFNQVDGATGMSMTNVSSITYSNLLTYDGYVNVHLSAQDLTVVAQADIGGNELTGTEKQYTLVEKNASGVSGTITFAERMNGESLATIALTGTPASGMHPAHIHENSAVETGNIAVTFNQVDGATGMSMTNVSSITYSNLLTYDGYVNIHLSAQDLTVVAQADIGGNELTGTSIAYDLGEKDVPGYSGELLLQERMNGNTLATITMVGVLTADAPAHIHMGSVAEAPGDIFLTFTPVSQTTNMSMTHIESTKYADLLTYDGYVNVHQSSSNLGTILAQGDIGSND